MAWTRNRPTGLLYRDKARSFRGYTLFSSVTGKHADLLDPEGRIVHQWHHPEGVQHVKWLENGHLLMHTGKPESAEGAESIGGCAGALVELDRDSNVVWEHHDVYMHHDYQRLANGNTLIVRWEKMPADVTARVKGGFVAPDDPEWMWGDVVREIDADGNTVRDWKSWEHISTDHHVKCPLESRKEWTHLNSLELTPDGDWLLSFRLTNTIVVINAKTGAPKWRFGGDEFSHQHHAQWLDTGRVLVFDNGCHRKAGPSFSRVVELDPKTKAVMWKYQSETIVAFYSFMVSGCERLPNGNTLIAEGASGRIFEVTAEGETVWEWVSPWLMPSGFGPTPALFRAYRIAEDDPRLQTVTLDRARYDALNAKIAKGDTLGEADEKRAARAHKPKKAVRKTQ